MKTKQFIIITSIALLIVPSLTFASWWNPFTWNIFQRPTEIKTEETITQPTSTSSIVVETEQSKTDVQTAEIEKLKKEVEELKKKPDPVVSAPTPTVPTVISNVNDNQTQVQNIQPVVVETWEEQKIRSFAYADDKGWTAIIITNSLGEEIHFHKEGSRWLQNSTEEVSSSSVSVPTAEQIKRYVQICNLPSMKKACTDEAYQAFYTNASYREGIDKMFIKIQDVLEQNQQNSYDQKKAQYECLMEPTPVELRTLSPQQQQRIRESKCGTATPSSDLNYKLNQQQEYQECLIEYTNKSAGLSPGDALYPMYGGDPKLKCDYLKPIFY